MREFRGILRVPSEEKIKKSPRSSLLASNLEFINANTLEKVHCLNFDAFFQHLHPETIFIFPFEDALYCLIQKKGEALENRAVLKWNEVDQYGRFIPHADIMIRAVKEGDLWQILQAYFPQGFKCYQIPFYFISHIQETYLPCEFGELKGAWEIRIHPLITTHHAEFKVPMTKNYILRSYQINAILAWEKNKRFGTIALATAGGKTLIGIDAILRSQQPTLIAVPTVPLVTQWQQDIMQFLSIPKSQIGLFFGSRKTLKPITIGTYQSLEKYMNFDAKARQFIMEKPWPADRMQAEIEKRLKIASFLNGYFGLLIFDESHHIPAPLFRHIALKSQALNRISLSATVERFDQNESLLYFASGQKIFELSYLDLCEDGWVVPFFYRYCPVKISDEEALKYASLANDKHAKRALTFFNDRKLMSIKRIVQSHLSVKHQILIFNSYVSSCLEIYRALLGLNIKVGLILSKENQKKGTSVSRETSIARFHKKELDVIISTTVLDEGFNVPDCCVGIITNGTSGERQLIQRVGRIVRKSPSDPFKIGYIYELTTESPDFLTIDHANRLLRNRMIESIESFNSSHELASPSCWTFDYDRIRNYAIKKSQIFKITPIHCDL